MDGVVWRELERPDEVATALIGLFEQRGGDRYDEVVTQTEHALQCGWLAIGAGADASTVVAAFLHDVGHLIVNHHDTERDLHHEDVAARFLANWFDERVTEPVRLHVAAKRYLCATSVGYLAELSPASIDSLALQGGPMTADEAAAFEREPMATMAVDVRRWDDQAKSPGAPTPTLDQFRDRIVDVLAG